MRDVGPVEDIAQDQFGGQVLGKIGQRIEAPRVSRKTLHSCERSRSLAGKANEHLSWRWLCGR